MMTLTQEIEALTAQIAGPAAVQGSLEWYLQNNLNEFASSVSNGGRDLENASRALMRFCTESMDWDTPLYRAAVSIAESGSRLAKVNR